VLARNPVNRAVVVVAGASFAYYLLLIASYHYWTGGSCHGPRLMGAALPFLCLGLAPVWTVASRPWRCLIAAVAAASVFVTFVAVSTHPMISHDRPSPWREHLLPSFLSGQLSQNRYAFFTDVPTPSFNAGEWLGLRGLPSLLPLAALWLVSGAAWVRGDRRAHAARA
jgi:hypothetical protein